MVNCWKGKYSQSAAKSEEIQEGSETISKESTPQGGSAMPLTCNDEGDDIVQQVNISVAYTYQFKSRDSLGLNY
jgi:hypothetical protein